MKIVIEKSTNGQWVAIKKEPGNPKGHRIIAQASGTSPRNALDRLLEDDQWEEIK